MKLLIVEDDMFSQKFYSTKLTESGYEVVIASDGLEAMQTIAKIMPDVILLDLIMPKMDGFEVLKQLSLDPALKKIPVIVFSSLEQEQDVEKARALGAVEIVNKSFLDFGSLLTKISSVIKPI